MPDAPPFVPPQAWARMSWHQRAKAERRREAWARQAFDEAREARAAAESALAAERAAVAAVDARRVAVEAELVAAEAALVSSGDPLVEARRWLVRVGIDPDAGRHMSELLAAIA